MVITEFALISFADILTKAILSALVVTLSNAISETFFDTTHPLVAPNTNSVYVPTKTAWFES